MFQGGNGDGADGCGGGDGGAGDGGQHSGGDDVRVQQPAGKPVEPVGQGAVHLVGEAPPNQDLSQQDKKRDGREDKVVSRPPKLRPILQRSRYPQIAHGSRDADGEHGDGHMEPQSHHQDEQAEPRRRDRDVYHSSIPSSLRSSRA